MKSYAVKNEATGLIDEAWTLAGLIDELAGIIRDEDPAQLSAEDLYARHFDMAVLEALRDFQITQQLMERKAVELPQLEPVDEEEGLGLRSLLERIRKGAEWTPYPATGHHIVNDVLVIGRVERFDDHGATYGTTVTGERTGAMLTDDQARELVLLEAVEGRMTNAQNRRANTDRLEEAGKIGERLVANLQLHGPGSVFDSLRALGIIFTSASPEDNIPGHSGERWLIRGATNVPAELPAWLKRKERENG